MPSNSNISLSHFWFFIFIIYCIITFEPVTCQTPLINNICHRTTFVNFCRQALMTDPASLTANLYILGMITNNLISANVTQTIHEIQVYLAHEQNITERFHTLNSCHLAYQSMQEHVSRMSIYWGNKKFMQTKVEARKGRDKLCEDCIAAIRDGESLLSANNLISLRLFTMAITMCDAA